MSPASRAQLTRIAILLADHRIADRTDRLRLVADHTGRPLHTMRQLTATEADSLIARLTSLPAGCDLRAAAGRIARAAEVRAKEAAR